MFTQKEEVDLQAGSKLLTLTWWVVGLVLGCPEGKNFVFR